jgi:hypothetical protein
MTLRQFMTIMVLATVLCWISFGMVVINIDPFQGSNVGFTFFYLSLFFALLGTASLMTFLGYRFFSREDLPMVRYVKKSFRYGIFFSLTGNALLFLQINAYLNFWNFTLFLLVIALCISFSFSASHPREGNLVE